jgi:hypothetical protein
MRYAGDMTSYEKRDKRDPSEVLSADVPMPPNRDVGIGETRDVDPPPNSENDVRPDDVRSDDVNPDDVNPEATTEEPPD